MEEVRLQKFLAENGIASRRKCEEYILDGRVKVNNEIVTTLGTKIDPTKDVVKFDDKPVGEKKQDYIYIILNKPIGVVTTAHDQFDRECVVDLIKIKQRVVPVGRLDMYTSGALILTNDGDFVYKVTHPKHEVTKTYNVTLKGEVTEEECNKLAEGIKLDDGFTTSKAKVKILKIDEESHISRIQITIHEGKNRQVRRMCEAIGKKVLALHRSKIGDITIKDLKLGDWRFLKQSEIDSLLK